MFLGLVEGRRGEQEEVQDAAVQTLEGVDWPGGVLGLEGWMVGGTCADLDHDAFTFPVISLISKAVRIAPLARTG